MAVVVESWVVVVVVGGGGGGWWRWWRRRRWCSSGASAAKRRSGLSAPLTHLHNHHHHSLHQSTLHLPPHRRVAVRGTSSISRVAVEEEGGAEDELEHRAVVLASLPPLRQAALPRQRPCVSLRSGGAARVSGSITGIDRRPASVS